MAANGTCGIIPIELKTGDSVSVQGGGLINPADASCFLVDLESIGLSGASDPSHYQELAPPVQPVGHQHGTIQAKVVGCGGQACDIGSDPSLTQFYGSGSVSSAGGSMQILFDQFGFMLRIPPPLPTCEVTGPLQ